MGVGAKVVAKCEISNNDILRDLCARLYTVHKPFIQTGRNWALVESSYQSHSNILLGPAAYINHDCDNNSIIHSLHKDLICIKVIKTIQSGDEITINYGPNYFGGNNRECLCITCEKNSNGSFLNHEQICPLFKCQKCGLRFLYETWFNIHIKICEHNNEQIVIY